MEEIGFRQRGNGSKHVVFIHGWMASGRVFDPFLDEDTLPGATAVLPDLRGVGSSVAHRGSVSVETLAKDVLSAMDRSEMSRASLVGHSMGGKVAQWLAIHEPARIQALLLVSPVPACAMALPDEVAEMFRHAGENRDALGKILDMACLSLPPDRKEALLDEAEKIPSSVIAAGFDAWAREDFSSDLPRLSAPTTVLATDDPFLPREFLQGSLVDTVAKGTLEYLPGVGHYPQLESPDEVRRIFRTWLAGIS